MKFPSLLLAALTITTLNAGTLDEDFSRSKDGESPGGDWKTADKNEGITVEIGRPAGSDPATNWVHFVDLSTEEPANIRHEVGPLTAGTLSLQLHIVKLTPLSIILGDEAASKPEERVVQIAVNEIGKVKIQSADPSINSSKTLEPGKTYQLDITFAPEGDLSTSVKVDVLEDGKSLEVIEGSSPDQRPITMLRITSQGEPTDGEFYVTGVKLTE